MAFTSDEIEACKNYMKLEDNTDDDLVESLMDAAAEYLSVAGVRTASARYNLALWALTLHYYDHRDDVQSQVDLPRALRLLINQLKGQGFTDPPPEASHG